MDTLIPLLESETVQNVRDIALIAVLLLLFVVLFVFAVLGIVLFRQMRRVAKRAETALSRVETGIEKFETAADSVSSFAATLTTTVGGAGMRGIGRMFTRWFRGPSEGDDAGGEAKTESGDKPKDGGKA